MRFFSRAFRVEGGDFKSAGCLVISRVDDELEGFFGVGWGV